MCFPIIHSPFPWGNFSRALFFLESILHPQKQPAPSRDRSPWFSVLERGWDISPILSGFNVVSLWGHLSLLHPTGCRAAARRLCGGWGPVCLPVHGELSNQGDVRVVWSGLVLVVQEVQVGSVDGETLSTELITQVVLIQLRELLLELKGRQEGLETRRRSPRGPACLLCPVLPWVCYPLDLIDGPIREGQDPVFIFLCNLIWFQRGDVKGQLPHPLRNETLWANSDGGGTDKCISNHKVLIQNIKRFPSWPSTTISNNRGKLSKNRVTETKWNSTFVWPDAFLSLELQISTSVPGIGKKNNANP